MIFFEVFNRYFTLILTLPLGIQILESGYSRSKSPADQDRIEIVNDVHLSCIAALDILVSNNDRINLPFTLLCMYQYLIGSETRLCIHFQSLHPILSIRFTLYYSFFFL